MKHDAANQPLSGLRVVEIGTSVAAPFAGWILGTLGAEVVKVERPGTGDDARQWGRMFPDGRSSFFTALNSNKRAITVDLRDEAERDWLRDYCVTSDVVFQNMRPGRVETLGLAAVDLIARNPKLVYCNMGAFGAKGPLKDRPGYDPLMQAYGGLMGVTGEEGRPPVRIGVSIIDMGTGMWATIGILSALLRRERTGQGCVVDSSLYETAQAWVTNQVTTVQADNKPLERLGSGARGMAPYQAYGCADGYLVVAAPNDKLFKLLCETLRHSEWLDDDRFSSNQRRFANLSDLNALLEPEFAKLDRSEWQARLDRAGIPNAPVQTIQEMMTDSQTEALGMLQQANPTDPKVMGAPLCFNGERPPLRTMPPSLGEHNDLIKGSGS